MNDFEDRTVEVITSRVEPELALFQVQIEGGFSHPTEPGKPSFGETPEAFDAVDVGLPLGELIPAVIDSQVLAITDIDQAVVTAPVVGVDHALGFHFASYNRLQRGFGAVRHDLGVDLAVALEDAEDDRLARSTASSLPLDVSCTEERFIDFDLPGERELLLGMFSQSFADRLQETVHGVAVQVGQLGDLCGLQIEREELRQLSEFGL